MFQSVNGEHPVGENAGPFAGVPPNRVGFAYSFRNRLRVDLVGFIFSPHLYHLLTLDRIG